MTPFSELRLDDARIDSLSFRGGVLLLNLTLWNAVKCELRIHDVIHLEVGPHLHTDLSHALEERTGNLLESACRRAEENPTDFACYSLVSAWDGRAILLAVGKDWEMSQ